MPTITKDDIWKGTSLLIVPLAGWVWSSNVKITQLELEAEHQQEQIVAIQKKVEAAEADSKQIIGIQKDIEYIKVLVGNIEKFVRN